MINPPDQHKTSRAAVRSRGFTLVEMMIAVAVGTVVLGAVAAMIVMTMRVVKKNQEIDSAISATRVVQEHLNRELSVAVSQTSPIEIRPVFSDPSSAVPPRFATVTYRVNLGSYGKVVADTHRRETAITVLFPVTFTSRPADFPKAGDFFLMDSPNLGTGIRITAVNPPDSLGNLTLTLASSIYLGTVTAERISNIDAAGWISGADAFVGKLVRIQRERSYTAVASADRVTELRWFETTFASAFVVLAKRLDTNARFLFAQVPEDIPATPGPPATLRIPALEPAVSWQFTYATPVAAPFLGGTTNRSDFFQTNYVEGLVMPKSGNPLSSAAVLGMDASTTSTPTTSTPTTATTTSTPTTIVPVTSTASSSSIPPSTIFDGE